MRTAPVQLNDAELAFLALLYGEFCKLSSISSSSLMAVVSDMRSSSDICNTRTNNFSKLQQKIYYRANSWSGKFNNARGASETLQQKRFFASWNITHSIFFSFFFSFILVRYGCNKFQSTDLAVNCRCRR